VGLSSVIGDGIGRALAAGDSEAVNAGRAVGIGDSAGETEDLGRNGVEAASWPRVKGAAAKINQIKNNFLLLFTCGFL
jgi:hypothetical protein